MKNFRGRFYTPSPIYRKNEMKRFQNFSLKNFSLHFVLPQHPISSNFQRWIDSDDFFWLLLIFCDFLCFDVLTHLLLFPVQVLTEDKQIVSKLKKKKKKATPLSNVNGWNNSLKERNRCVDFECSLDSESKMKKFKLESKKLCDQLRI